jgi:DNA polymerase
LAGSDPFVELKELNAAICTCQRCPLSMSRTKAVPGEGPTPSQLMLIGEAPGAEEDKLGRPFVGRAGVLMDRSLLKAGLKRQDLFITNVVKCRPPGNRKPKKEEIEACRPYLERQMEIVAPQIIALLGNVATNVLLGKRGVTTLHGKVFGRFLVTYHPAAVIRNRNLEDAFLSDLFKLSALR